MPNYVSIKWIWGCDDEYWPFRSVTLWTMECCPELISTAKKIMLIQQRFIKFPCFVIFFLYDSMIRKLCLSWHQKGIWHCTSEAKGIGKLHLTGSAVSAASWDTLHRQLPKQVHLNRDTNYWGCSWVLYT